jgi:hypothetical protein
MDKFVEIDEKNLDNNENEIAFVSHLLRFKSKGDSVKDKNLLLVKVGTVWKGYKYHFKIYSETDLDAIGAEGNTHIFCNSEKSDSYAKAEWIIEDQMVVGVRLECKVACFEEATIKETRFSQYPLAKQETVTIQNGGIVESKPNQPHELPAEGCNLKEGNLPDLTAIQVPEARTDFKNNDRVSGSQDLILSVEEIAVNNDRRMWEGQDNFAVLLSFLNCGQDTFMFTDLKVEYKLLNEDEWKVCKNVDYGDYGKPFPLTLPSFQSTKVQTVARVPYNEDEKELRSPMNRSHLAGNKPMRFRFTMVDVKGREVSRVAEYVQKLPSLEVMKGSTTFFLFIDNPLLVSRKCIRLETKQDKGDRYLIYGDMSFEKDEAKKLVHKALKEQKSEILMENKGRDRDEDSVQYYALVDVACKAVYAVKVVYVDKGTGYAKQGYCPVRYYGEDDAPTVEGIPATEEVELPSTVKEIPPIEQLFNYDDEGKDDLKEEDLMSGGTTSGGGAGGAVGGGNFASLEKQLASLNDNLARTATALEALVALQLTRK